MENYLLSRYRYRVSPLAVLGIERNIDRDKAANVFRVSVLCPAYVSAL